MATRQDKIINGIKGKLNKYIKIINIAKEKKLNEADTRNIIDNFMKDVLNYEMFDITSEYRIKAQYADYCLKIKDKPCVLMEVKAINSDLKESHLFQVTSYAVNEGIEWVVLTNGDLWQLFHLGSKMPVEKHLVLQVDLSNKDIRPKQKAKLFYHLSKDSLVSGDTAGYWAKKSALSPKNIAKIVLEDRVLNAVRIELKKQTGYNVDVLKLRKMIRKNVLKKSTLEK